MRDFFFEIDKGSRIEAETVIEGVRVSIEQEKNSLAVEGVNIEDLKNALEKAEQVANNFLNYLSWKYNEDYRIKRDGYRSETTNEDGEKQVLVHVSNTVTVIQESLKIERKDESGEIISVSYSNKLGKLVVNDSEASSYFRSARLSSDPFDKFRNFYLVAENISDQIRIKSGLASMYEQPMLELGLSECFGTDIKPLENIAHNVSAINPSNDTVQEVATYFYKSHRCQLNHSKALQDKKIPFNPEDEKQVKEALPLMEFVAKSFLQYEEQSL